MDEYSQFDWVDELILTLGNPGEELSHFRFQCWELVPYDFSDLNEVIRRYMLQTNID